MRAFSICVCLLLALAVSGCKRILGGDEEAAPPSNAATGSSANVIVVLGSSTAAGFGPANHEHAWVERYRDYLAKRYSNFELINLAVPGYTTYQIQPTDYAPPSGRPAPDPEHNVTKALSLHADAIIVNMPNNDQASGFQLAELLANYDRLAALVKEHGTLLWGTTTQPRDLSESELAALIEARHAIEQKFGDYSIDFWASLAEADGTIKSKYDSGDGVHLNDDAHALLAERVFAENIPEKVLASVAKR